ncbi:hypothetical protein POTOM_034172 [Populus tomentosa]|uniref:Uncharacterized protein n=1 Tax=Populus tomentosa TaxID=118781 RepID=A0A8X8CP67_POPTO|nr:hypothetical protein POTOM_034172 [Populus tomentosa]
MFSYMVSGCGSNSGPGVRTRRNSLESNQRVPSRYHLLVLLRLWKVLGSSRVVSSMRALSIGDKVSWTRYCGLCQHDLRSIDSTMLSQTKQVPIEEVYLLFQNHWYWKKIVGDGTNDDELDGKKGQAT